jgi:hypothetical protein
MTCGDRPGAVVGSDDRCPRGSPLYPVGHRCIWHGFGTGGGWWARPTRPRSLIPGRLCVGSLVSRVALAPSRQRRRLGGALEYARHGRLIGGGSPLEEEVVLTPSRRQLRRREAGWEGSPRRTSAPRDTNRGEGGAIWVSLLKKAKPVTINRVVA